MQEFFGELPHFDVAFEEETGEGVDADGLGAECGGFDADACEEWFDCGEQLYLRGAGVDGNGHEEALAFEVASEDAVQQVFEHHALVECVLIDDDDAFFVLGDDVGVVDLEEAVGGERDDWPRGVEGGESYFGLRRGGVGLRCVQVAGIN